MVGAATVYGLAWVVVLVLPMLAAIQAISAAIGGVCRTSLQGAIRRECGTGWALATLVAIVAVNVVTLAADVEAGAESLTLLTGVPFQLFIVPFVAAVGWLLVSKSYLRVERVLSFLPLIFLCYGASAIAARADWGALLRGVVVPHFALSPAYASGALALIGTTLTSYVYLWESIEVAERRPRLANLRFFKADATFGVIGAGVSFLFILAATGATLGARHLPVETAADAAAALTPVAGPWAGALFGTGLLASAVLAVPILAGSTAYAVAQTFGWPGSLDAPFGAAPRFYAVVLGALAVAAVASFAGIPPIALLYWASIAGGIATPLTLFFAVRIASDRKVMGEHRIGRPLAAAGWAVTAIATLACVAFGYTLLKGSGG